MVDVFRAYLADSRVTNYGARKDSKQCEDMDQGCNLSSGAQVV